MDELVRCQRSVALDGRKEVRRTEKKINFDTVQKQLNAGVPFNCYGSITKGERRDIEERNKGRGIRRS